ncbi:MAG: GtrA family protein [Phyllobacteriaceae bacterium]|nr:GtrA family protein [Phyllobacteriaceae bacterium]
MRRFIRFAAVGAAGFLVDAGVLAMLLGATPLGPFVARIFSIAIAMATTWLLNRAFTFGPSRHSVAAEGFRYALVAVAVAAVNWLVYSALLLAAPGTPPLLALFIASGLAMALSYIGYSRAVFGRK